MKGIQPASGFAMNPLHRNDFRNRKCFCNSEKKIKNCCGLSRYIKKGYAEYLNLFLAGNIEAAEEVLKDMKEKGE